jgi:HlyD family secretion protein
MKGKRGFFLIILAASLLAAGYGACRWLGEEEREFILVSGNIEMQEVNMAFPAAGQLVELNVEEGDCVQRDAVVARLDSERLLRQREAAEAALRAARSQMTQLETAIRFQEETLAGQVGQRAAELKLAAARLRELQTGSRPQEVEQAEAALDQARAELERASNDHERARLLYEKGTISAAHFDFSRAAFRAAAAAARQAEERLAVIREGPRSEAIEAAQAQLEHAGAGLHLAESIGLELKRKRQEMETRKAEIERVQAEIRVIDTQLRDTSIRSPIDGFVILKSAESGEFIGAGMPVATLGDLARPWVRAYVSQQDLGRVKLGSKVRVRSDSFPGKIYWGRVSFISPQAEFTPKQIQTPEERLRLVYRIKIDVPNPDFELKSNMPVEAEILLGPEGGGPLRTEKDGHGRLSPAGPSVPVCPSGEATA